MTTPVKFNLRLPPDLHEQATAVAERMGVSLNAFVVMSLHNWVEYQGKRISERQPRPRTAAPATARPRPLAVPRVATPTMEQRDPSWPKVGRNDPCPCGSRKKAQ